MAGQIHQKEKLLSLEFNQYALFLLFSVLGISTTGVKATETLDSGVGDSGTYEETQETVHDESEYTEFVFQNCEFSPTEISWRFGNFDDGSSTSLVPITTTSTEEIMSQLSTWLGRDIWLGYTEDLPAGAPSGFDLPTDVIDYGKIRIRRGTDEDWESRQEIWLLYSESENEFYIYPFDDMHPFTDEEGLHYGIHPCGAYAISRETIDELLELFTEETR